MTDFLNVIWEEINSKINTSLPLVSSTKVMTAIKVERYDLRNLIALFDITGTSGLVLPLIVVRFSPASPADYGLQNEAYEQDVDFIFIDRSNNTVSTTITTGATNAVQAVASSTGMFVGQRLYFATAKAWRTIVTINSATQITLDSSIATTTAEVIVSELQKDIQSRIQLIKDIFSPKTTFTNFQILEQGTIDVTDYNPVNSAIMEKNAAMLSGSYKVQIVYGEAY